MIYYFFLYLMCYEAPAGAWPRLITNIIYFDMFYVSLQTSKYTFSDKMD